MLKKGLLSLIFLLLSSLYLQAQDVVPQQIKTIKPILNEFMDLRFGMFIHWGPVALRGTEIGWSRNHQVKQNDYDNLYKEFNPVLFDAENWVKTAKDAGMKYLTIIAKHHDGFCLWPSAFTNYNISNTPFKKDVVGELAKACKKYDIKFCIYYTVLDWYSPDYPLHNDGKKNPDPKAYMGKFTANMKNQLKELISNYHPYMLWFDGNWEEPWTQSMAVDMYTYIKKLDPNVIINNRLGKGDHNILNDQSVGDFATPEQKIGAINMEIPWESCITIGQQWSWKPNENLKPLKQCIQTLTKTAGGNGNLLFNVGPMPDGRIELRQINQLKGIGNWLQKYGEAIYSTKGGPFKPDSTFSSTRKGTKIYLHLFAAEKKQIQILAIPNRIVQKAYWLHGDPVKVQQSNSLINLTWTGKLPDENCPVMVLELDGDAESIPLIGNQL